jgi:hypothetical protein
MMITDDEWLLVTTTRSFLLLDPRTGSGYRLDTGRGLYYGITVWNGEYLVGARRRVGISHFPECDEKGEILQFDQEFNFQRALMPRFPLRGMHQILSFGGKLWVTCTFDNMVAIFNGTGWEQWHPLGVPETEVKDRNHFNSISAIDGQLCVLANNWGESELLFFNLPERTLHRSIPLGRQAHNVWREGDRWMTCSSTEGRIVGSDGISIQTGGFPRGIAFSGGKRYVGISTHCERALRNYSNSWIQIYDRRWQRVGTLDLVHEGMVLDFLPVGAASADNCVKREQVQYLLRWESESGLPLRP